MKLPTRLLITAVLLGLPAFASLSAENVRVIVGFHGDADAGVFSRLGGQADIRLDRLGAVAGTIPAGRLNALRGQPGVSFVEEDLVRFATAEPNDTYYNYTFANRYENRGYNDQRDDFALINAPAAWDVTTGAGVTVAVLDTGIDTDHPEFLGKIVSSKNFTTTGSTSDVTDTDGHGTHTAGTIAARTNNGRGVAGTAWNASLAIGKVLGPQGGYDSWVADGMMWAVDVAGAPIVSMSLGGEGTTLTLANACVHVWTNGGVTIAAAGNDGVDASNHYPSAHSDVVAVAAVNERGDWAGFSNYGPTLEVAAPGVNVLSTMNGGYGWASGTSMACPHVSGVAALLLEAHSWDNTTLRSQLALSGSAVNAPDGATVPIVDATAALASSTPSPSVEIVSPLPGETVSGTSVTIAATASASTASAGVTQVEFFVDGAWVGTDTSDPYSIVWDSTSIADASGVVISAQVTDSDAATANDAIAVTVDNVDDPPTVTITNPADGSTVSGLVTLSADAFDDKGVASVEFMVNGSSVFVDNTAPYEYEWDSTGAPQSSTIQAVATDTNSATHSDSVSVTVAAPSSMEVYSINPNSISSPQVDFPVTITGTGFSGPTTVMASNGSGPAPTFVVVQVSDSQIDALLTIKSGGPPRNRSWDIEVISGGASDVLEGGLAVAP